MRTRLNQVGVYRCQQLSLSVGRQYFFREFNKQRRNSDFFFHVGISEPETKSSIQYHVYPALNQYKVYTHADPLIGDNLSLSLAWSYLHLDLTACYTTVDRPKNNRS